MTRFHVASIVMNPMRDKQVSQGSLLNIVVKGHGGGERKNIPCDAGAENISYWTHKRDNGEKSVKLREERYDSIYCTRAEKPGQSRGKSSETVGQLLEHKIVSKPRPILLIYRSHSSPMILQTRYTDDYCNMRLILKLSPTTQNCKPNTLVLKTRKNTIFNALGSWRIHTVQKIPCCATIHTQGKLV